MEIKEEILSFLESSSADEQEALALYLKSLKTKREHLHKTYIASLLDFKSTRMNENTLEMEMPNTLFLDNSIGIVHGGLTATLLDTAMGTIASMVPGNSKGKGAVTVEMKVDFLAPGVGDKFICTATVIQNGRQLVRTEGKVHNEKGTLIASATGTFFKLKNEE